MRVYDRVVARYRLLAISLLVACRGGFDQLPGAGIDADVVGDMFMPTVDSPPVPALSPLTCTGGAVAESIQVDNPDAMVAIGTDRGFAVFTANQMGEVRGWTFDVNNGALVRIADNVLLDSNSTGMTTVGFDGTHILLANVIGGISPTGTHLHVLDTAILSDVVPMMTSSTFSVRNGVTKNANTSGFAYVTQGPTTAAMLHTLDDSGHETGSAATIIPDPESADNISIIPVNSQYAATYIANAASPPVVRAFLLDASFAPVGGAVSPSTGIDNVHTPALAYCPSGNDFIVAWTDKDATGMDQVFYATLDSTLATTKAATSIATMSNTPADIEIPGAFWLSWLDYNTGKVESAVIDGSGTATPYPIANTGWPYWDVMTKHADQSVLIWNVSGTTGNLLFQPYCP